MWLKKSECGALGQSVINSKGFIAVGLLRACCGDVEMWRCGEL